MTGALTASPSSLKAGNSGVEGEGVSSQLGTPVMSKKKSSSQRSISRQDDVCRRLLRMLTSAWLFATLSGVEVGKTYCNMRATGLNFLE